MVLLRACPYCGGSLYFDKEDREWHCLNCGRRPKVVSVNNNRVSATDNFVSVRKNGQSVDRNHKKATEIPQKPISTDSNRISTGKNLLTTGDNVLNYARKPTARTITTQSKAIEKIPVTPAISKWGRPFDSVHGPENIYRGHAIEGAWWPPREITFRRRQMLFLIKSLPELRAGYWPANPVGSGYIDLPMARKGKARSRKAYFETPAEYAAEIENRLEKVGIDGLILLAIECWEESQASLSKYLKMPEWSINKRANKALRYISGWERRSSQNHKGDESAKGEDRFVKFDTIKREQAAIYYRK